MNHHGNHPLETDSGSDGKQTTVKAKSNQTDGESIIPTIATTVSEAVGKEPADIPPLYNTIDPEALANLFGWDSVESPRLSSGSVNFQYEGCKVTVFADGQVVVSPLER
ncbi:HalOD1 output domain-containing protein [Haloarcula sp. JP-L23]|uniref:HalOD1 output domain-containing protein n=1 Tax=Haloarcula sp. JP-L23 TaxID=2716717 RepID=UPI00140F006A|nr:hypothetical protein G9465_19325 [Haloarcula sp. JP-L23]